MMIGVIGLPVFMTSLLLLGIIFYLRRCLNKKSSSLAVDTTRATLDASSQTMGQQECGMIFHGRDSTFLDHGGTPQRDSTLTVVTAQGQCSLPGRSSQISMASSISRSIRFAVTGSFNSSAGSYVSRAAMSTIAVDGTHTPDDNISGEPVSPWRSVSVNASHDYSASWRGTNLSNIINAARGIKG